MLDQSMAASLMKIWFLFVAIILLFGLSYIASEGQSTEAFISTLFFVLTFCLLYGLLYYTSDARKLVNLYRVKQTPAHLELREWQTLAFGGFITLKDDTALVGACPSGLYLAGWGFFVPPMLIPWHAIYKVKLARGGVWNRLYVDRPIAARILIKDKSLQLIRPFLRNLLNE